MRLAAEREMIWRFCEFGWGKEKGWVGEYLQAWRMSFSHVLMGDEK